MMTGCTQLRCTRLHDRDAVPYAAW